MQDDHEDVGFLTAPDVTPAAQRMFDEDIEELGYVMNVSRLWAYQPATVADLFKLLRQTSATTNLSVRHRFILVSAFAPVFGDSYCSLAWGNKLAKASDAQTAAAVLRGTDEGLNNSERALATWARHIARDPNNTSASDVQALRDAGFSDSEIFTITVFVALRLAFSAVNDALGVRPDAALRTNTPKSVLDAITFGRPIQDEA
ncbi:carboxymuconolactone decarboxylase family protein [Kribbella sp. NPDC004536]|uniref:carboxymuconolactone decarboxylase family protein n=1 Tax=Kribbella sp. NPDC004536 TaxID=3364106 RepID=UPI0036968F9F